MREDYGVVLVRNIHLGRLNSPTRTNTEPLNSRSAATMSYEAAPKSLKHWALAQVPSKLHVVLENEHRFDIRTIHKRFLLLLTKSCVF